MRTYSVALPFTPHDTCLYRLYEGETSNSITVLQGLDPIWTPYMVNLVCYKYASMSGVSPDRTLLAVETQVQLSPKHTETITCYAVDLCASLLATGSRDMSVILWSLTTGDHSRTLLRHKKEILSLKFSEDGVLLASGSGDHIAIVWDVASGNVLHALGPHDGCDRVLVFSEDHRHLTTATPKEIWVWELKSGELVEFRGRETEVNEAQKRPYKEVKFDWSGYQRLGAEGMWWYFQSEPWEQVAAMVLPCLLPPGYQIDICLVLQDRAVFLCGDGTVLIVDTSRIEVESASGSE